VNRASGFDSALMGGISGFIAEEMGLHFPAKRWPDLARGLKAAGHDLGFEDFDAFARSLMTRRLTVRQVETLAGHLTVGETYFFRDPASFEVLGREILPPLVTGLAETSRSIRLWSAGCCTGEEAFSLAITCQRAVPDLRQWNVSILATDINPKFLRKAAAGVYSHWSFRGVPGWVRERHFEPAGARSFLVDPALRELVHFAHLNLVTDAYPSLHNQTNAMDVIFCRNVLMYFTPRQQQRVVAALHRCLVDGGYLVVSPVEAGPDLLAMFAMEDHGGILLYRKTSQAARPLPASPVVEPAFLGGQAEPAPAAALAPAPSPPVEAQVAQPEPGRARSPLLLARIYADQGRLDEALTWCQRAIAAERTEPSAHFLCATIYQELGRLQEAIAAFGKVLFLDQDFVLAHHALGGLYKRLGKQTESRRHLAVALKLLSARSKDEVLPESDGMTCGRLVESVRAMTGA
jgi:chemotaxis protein methyltransferase CheR